MSNKALSNPGEVQEPDKRADTDLHSDKKRTTFIAPIVGESFRKYTSPEPADELEKAKEDLQELQKSQLTQQVYELIRDNTLNAESLAAHTEGGAKGNMEAKCSSLKQRYIIDDEGVMRDKRREDKIICEPSRIFDVVICAHLINNRMTYKPLYKHLNETYANITRDFVLKAVRCCSKIISGSELTPMSSPLKQERRKPTENIHKSLMPLERLHLEILRPFENELIGRKYSHILYWRDYQSRYVWLLPLKNIKLKNLISTIANFLLNLPHLPIFMESSTFGRQDLFDICENICKTYHLKIGLGNNNSAQFQLNGIESIKSLLLKNKSSCIKDWNMCIWHGSYLYNRTYNSKSFGIPNNQLWNNLTGLGENFEAKRDELLENSSSNNVVEIVHGLIHLEDDKAIKLQDEEREVMEKNITVNKRLSGEIVPTHSDSYELSEEISKPSSSYYDGMVSPSKKRRQVHREHQNEISTVL